MSLTCRDDPKDVVTDAARARGAARHEAKYRVKRGLCLESHLVVASPVAKAILFVAAFRAEDGAAWVADAQVLDTRIASL